jgi:GNAT superfamily N-acetyltransferase
VDPGGLTGDQRFGAPCVRPCTLAGSAPRESRLEALLPSTAFTDREGRRVDLRPCGDGPVDEELEALVDIYREYPSEDRTMGLPPVGEKRIRAWLETVLEGHCLVAWHDTRPVGLAVLVPDDGRHEFAVFLDSGYQGAGIGTRLTETMLAHGRQVGVEAVWLVVERSNRPAVQLYREVGFVVTDEAGYDLEMSLVL